MKIAIRGHKSRGKEVIQILESLGGINICQLTGTDKKYYYYINNDPYKRIHCHDWDYINECKKYTLEEFETQFPFKVGDKVIHKEYDTPFEVVEFDPENVYPYTINGPCDFRTKSCALTKYQPKMKEERNITLTLDKAKEWYKKGGELKEVALQAYSEEELNKVELPKTWKEFCASNPIKVGEAFISSNSVVRLADFTTNRNSLFDKQICPSDGSASAHLAMIQLEQLRDCWRQSWKPDWNDANQKKYCICYHQGKFKISMLYETRHFLSFPTQEMAEDFLKCFDYLIEKVEDLI